MTERPAQVAQPAQDERFTSPVTAVRAAHRLDVTALQRWLSGRLPGADEALTVRQFEGGQSNPTYLLETPAGRWVLRKKPPGPLMASAHLIEREQRVLLALQGSQVPVPAVPVYCHDESILGTMFFVMDYVHGRIPRDPALPGMSSEDRTATYAHAIETLAHLHALDIGAHGLADFGKSTGYLTRQLSRWSRQYDASPRSPDPSLVWLMQWLPAHMPQEQRATIIHGDFRLDNLVLHPESPRVVAVLDWELSTLGDPWTDLFQLVLPYHLDRDETGLRGLKGHDLGALGVPSIQQLVARYCEARGVPVPSGTDLVFYQAFGLFRMAAILDGIEARRLQGNASASNASAVAAQSSTFAEAARRVAESGV